MQPGPTTTNLALQSLLERITGRFINRCRHYLFQDQVPFGLTNRIRSKRPVSIITARGVLTMHARHPRLAISPDRHKSLFVTVCYAVSRGNPKDSRSFKVLELVRLAAQKCRNFQHVVVACCFRLSRRLEIGERRLRRRCWCRFGHSFTRGFGHGFVRYRRWRWRWRGLRTCR